MKQSIFQLLLWTVLAKVSPITSLPNTLSEAPITQKTSVVQETPIVQETLGNNYSKNY